MNRVTVITGTDTGVGKTVFSAALTAALDGAYWKPVQAGLEGATDSQIVQRLSGLSVDRVLPEAYRLATPQSPHAAAERDGVTIDAEALSLPESGRPLVVEGAGGLLVPLTSKVLQIDVFARWGAPVVLCARTSLGTINHSLLSIAALKSQAIPILGIAFIGAPVPDTEIAILEFARVPRLGRLPRLDPLHAASLAEAFRAHFDIQDFAGLDR